MARNALIQLRRDTAANWTSTNPTLAAGEMGFETDTGKFKIGTGSTAWISLLYATDISDISGIPSGDYLSPYNGFRNAIINGSFEIWQRGTSRTFLSAGQYRADRWTVNLYQNAAHQRVSVTPVSGMQTRYALRVGSATTAEAAGGARLWANTTLESANSIPLRNQSVTLSFWVRFSSATVTSSTATAYGNWTASISYYSSTTDGPTATTAYSSSTDYVLTNGSLPTGWTKYTVTGTVPSGANNVGVQFGFAGLGNTASADAVWYEITQVQLERGTYATPFEQRPIQTELALCQRYYEKSYAQGTVPGTATLTGAVSVIPYTTTAGKVVSTVRFAVPKRSAPTVTIYSTADGSSGYWFEAGFGNRSGSSQYITETSCVLYNTVVAAAAGAEYTTQWVAAIEL